MPVHAAPVLDGAVLSWPWSLPFVGMLLTIASGPLLFPRIWSRHYGKITAGWSALTVFAVAFAFGAATAFDAFLHAMLLDYMSFIALLFSLYVVAGGIQVTGNLHGTPSGNAGMLLLGTVLASFVGTTGAAMIMVRPLIKANERRQHKAHVLVFAIFLVANVGYWPLPPVAFSQRVWRTPKADLPTQYRSVNPRRMPNSSRLRAVPSAARAPPFTGSFLPDEVVHLQRPSLLSFDVIRDELDQKGAIGNSNL
jgi:hypothetical protein